VKNQVPKILSGAICRPSTNPAPLPLPFQNTGPQCQCKIAAEDEKRGSLRFQKGILRLHVLPLRRFKRLPAVSWVPIPGFLAIVGVRANIKQFPASPTRTHSTRWRTGCPTLNPSGAGAPALPRACFSRQARRDKSNTEINHITFQNCFNPGTLTEHFSQLY
jgi:hypothetical protein